MRRDPNANSSAPHDRQRFYTAGALAFFIPFVLYVFTAARTVTFEDSGLFALIAKSWGVAHPPGYPVYTFLAHLFSYLPVGELAFRVALFSASCGAGATLVLFLILNKWTGRIRLALPGALIAASSATFWGQALVPEVYAFNIFLNLLFLYLMVRLSDDVHSRELIGIGVVAGLNLANHWPLFILSLPGLLLLSPKRIWKFKRIGVLAAAGLVTAAVSYLVLYFRSQSEAKYSFFGPLQGLGELWSYVMRDYYAAGDKSVLVSAKDGLGHFLYFLKCLWSEDFVPGLAILALIGIWFPYREGRKSWIAGLIYWLSSSSVLLLFFLRLEHNDFNRNVMHVFWIGPFVAFSVLATMGAAWCEARFKNAGLWLLTAFMAAQILLNFNKNNLRKDELAKNYGEIILKSVPKGSVLVASTDGDVGPIAYVNEVFAPNDVELYTGTGVFFHRRIFDPRVQGAKKRYKETLAFVNRHDRIFSVKGLHIFGGRDDLPLKVNFSGLTYKYSPFESFATPPPRSLVEETKQTLDRWLQSADVRNWPYHRETLLSRLCNYIILQGEESHGIYEKSPGCMQVKARHLSATGRREEADRLYMKWLGTLDHPVLREKQQYIYHFLVNRLELINSLRDKNRQIRLYAEGLAIAEPTLFEYPLCDNMVAPLLRSLRGPISISEKAKEQLVVFKDCG